MRNAYTLPAAFFGRALDEINVMSSPPRVQVGVRLLLSPSDNTMRLRSCKFLRPELGVGDDTSRR